MLSILTCSLRMCTVCISLKQVDVILGVNWLELNQVFTSCFDKLILFLESNEDVDATNSRQTANSVSYSIG